MTGDARIDTALSEATLTVRHNDDPVVFSNSIVEVQEGENVVLNIIRGGAAEGINIIMYKCLGEACVITFECCPYLNCYSIIIINTDALYHCDIDATS